MAVIDRFNGGGSTKISGGIVYAGGGISIQQEAGVEDSPENMFNYLRYAAMYLSPITWLLRAAPESLENRFSQPVLLRATHGVVLSTGGFFYNRDMVSQHAPKDLPGMPLGTIGDDGSGILMGESVGGHTRLMDNVSQWRFINPPEAFIRGILVDRDGKRICNEMYYEAQLNQQIMQKADGKAIGGLYAAGRCAVGVVSHSYVSGISIAGCVFSGRRAGRHAAGKALEEPGQPFCRKSRQARLNIPSCSTITQ